MEKDKTLRQQLIANLQKAQAHASIEHALKGIPFEQTGSTAHGLPYTIWQLAEHLRIAQWDILDFSHNPEYSEMKWPDDYWPKENAPKNQQAWDDCISAIFKDLGEFIALVEDQQNNLYEAFPWGTGQNLLREALLLADHNAYHVGEIVMARKILGCWRG